MSGQLSGAGACPSDRSGAGHSDQADSGSGFHAARTRRGDSRSGWCRAMCDARVDGYRSAVRGCRSATRIGYGIRSWTGMSYGRSAIDGVVANDHRLPQRR